MIWYSVIGLKNENIFVCLYFQFEFVIDMNRWLILWLVRKDEYAIEKKWKVKIFSIFGTAKN